MLWKLTKIRLLGLFSRSAGQKKKGKQTGRTILFAFLLVYCLVAFSALFYLMFDSIADVLVLAPTFRWFYFAMTGLLAFALSFFFTAFTAKSELFEAKDNELLLSMPIPPRTILMSRMLVLLGSEYLFSLLVFATSGAAWFLKVGVNARELTFYILGSLFLPLLGASLASLVGWLLARLTARARNKTLVTMIFSLGFLAIYFYFYFNAQTYIQQLLANYQAVAEGVSGWGFLFAWYGLGIAEGRLPLLLGTMGLCLGAFALAVLLISRGFLKISSSEAKKERKKGGAKIESSSLSSALFRKEVKRFTSSAVYMMNCGLGLILEPVAAVFLLVKADTIRGLIRMLTAQGLTLTSGELGAMAGILLAFFSSMVVTTAPSLSMEGKNLWIVKEAPIPVTEILWAKLRLHLVLACPAALVLSLAGGFVLEVDVLGWLWIILVPQIFALLSGAFGLMMNLLMPKLDWTNETVPVKQSAAPALTILGIMGYVMVAALGMVLLVFNEAACSVGIYLAAVIGLAALGCLLSLLWLRKRGVKRFEAL